MTRQLKVDAKKLLTEVSWLNRMPTAGPETAVIQVNAVLSALVIRKTCLDQYREAVIPVEGAAQTTILVDSGKLSAALKKVSGQIAITVDDDGLTIQDSNRTVRLGSADKTVEFPKWPRFTGRGKEALTARKVTHALTSVCTDEMFPQLTVVAFDNGTMVSTDQYRLSAITYDTSGFTGMVSGSVLRAFDKDGIVFIEAGTCAEETAEWVELRSGMRSLLAPMPDAQFPEWRRLIPEESPLRVALPREELFDATTGEQVTLVVDGDVLTVTSDTDGITTEQRIKVYQTIRNELDGPFTATLKSRYVKDSLRGISSGLVLMECSEPGKPVMFTDIGERDRHLIVPVRYAS